MVAPFVSCPVPTLSRETLPILSAAAQHGHNQGAEAVSRPGPVARVSELDQALQAYLRQVTMRVIREEVFADASDAQEISEALPPN
jgi:hypothetical protein